MIRDTGAEQLSELMTLPDLAVYLRVSERTIYEWAQQGNVPAYKVGAAWRFRRDEIDQWLLTQRSGPALGPKEGRCSVCSRKLTDDIPPVGYCIHVGCDRPICGSCWGTLQRRSCPAHLGLDDSGGEEDPLAAASQDTHTDVIGGRHSNASTRLLGSSFLDGFSKRVESLPYLTGSKGTSIVPVRSWQRVRETGSTKTGDRVAYTLSLPEAVLRITHDTLRLEARVVKLNPRRTRRTQRQSKPVTRKMLDQMLDNALSLAKEGGFHYVLGLYAPHGWAEDARRLFDRPEPAERFLNPNLSVALIGIDSTQVAWNPDDPVLAEVGSYYRATPEDEVTKCIGRLRELLSVSGVYLVSRIVKEEGFEPNIAREAIGALVGANEIEVVCERNEEAIVRKE